jgi:hypothetical protein
MSQLGRWSILLAFVMMMPLIPIMGIMWGSFKSDSSEKRDRARSSDAIEKRKRDRLDAVLRDLSDDDLRRLKQRLTDGTIDDEQLYDRLVGDDGELVDYSG